MTEPTEPGSAGGDADTPPAGSFTQGWAPSGSGSTRYVDCNPPASTTVTLTSTVDFEVLPAPEGEEQE